MQREWADKDFYKELGVSKDATQDEIKKAYRKLARSLHPDANPGDKAAEERFKRVSEANAVLSDPKERKEYDELRAMLSSGFGGFGGKGGFGAPGGFGNGFGQGAGGFTGFTPSGGHSYTYGADGFDIGDLGDIFGGATQNATGGAGGIGDILGGLFNQRRGGGHRPEPPQQSNGGANITTSITINFRDAAKGATVPIRITSKTACTTCHGSGARPGTAPRTCPECNGSGFRHSAQGAFQFSQPCTNCGGTGTVIEDPCSDCGGSGVVNRTRTLKVRVPAGIKDGQKVRLNGKGEAGLRGAPPGDLFVKINIIPDKVFQREGNNLLVDVPVSFSELALGATVTVPTLDGTVSIRIPAGSTADQVMRVRGRGIAPAKEAAGDLLATLKVQIPTHLDADTSDALKNYAQAEQRSGFDPRAGWAGAV